MNRVEEKVYAPCSHPGCKEPATCRPVVYIHSKKKPEGLIKPNDLFLANFVAEDKYTVCYVVCLQYCYNHQGSFKPKRMMDEACWSAIDNQFAGLGCEPPTRDGYKVVWEDACGANGLEIPEPEEFITV